MVRSTGLGCIIVAPLMLSDLSKYPDDAYKYANLLYTASMDYSGSINSAGNNVNISSYTLKEILGYMEKPANTGKAFMIFLMTIYVVLVGPVLYLILKAVKQREKIWLCIPALSLIFVGLIFLFSLSVRMNGLSMRSVSMHDMKRGVEDAYIMGYQPTHKEWSVKIPEDYRYALGFASDYDSFLGDKNVKGAVKSGNPMTLTYYPSSSFETGNFRLIRPSEYDGSIDIDMGMVTNNTGADFEYMLVVTDGRYQILENVKNGDTVAVNLSLNTSYSMIDLIAGTPYKNKDYKKAGAYAALCLTYEAIQDSSSDIIVIGVRKQDGITDQKEPSWETFYYVEGIYGEGR